MKHRKCKEMGVEARGKEAISGRNKKTSPYFPPCKGRLQWRQHGFLPSLRKHIFTSVAIKESVGERWALAKMTGAKYTEASNK